MKKVILFSWLLTSVYLAKSQSSYFGADAGINLASQVISSQSSSMAARPTAGVFYHWAFSEKFAARVNAQYMGMGYSNGPIGDLSINYLTFPLALHFSANEKLSFNGGAYVSFTLGGTMINSNEITKTYHKNDNGFYGGAEYDLSKKIAVSLNYYLGTKNIWLDDQGGTIELNNRALQLLLIYKFRKANN
jgi:hypothetical protein